MEENKRILEFRHNYTAPIRYPPIASTWPSSRSPFHRPAITVSHSVDGSHRPPLHRRLLTGPHARWHGFEDAPRDDYEEQAMYEALKFLEPPKKDRTRWRKNDQGVDAFR